MKENKYDDPVFFEKYSQMSRSQEGLAGAGEWETLHSMLPDFAEKHVLDLGCGYGWHCIYACLLYTSLLGYDHENGGLARVRMREKEETVMRQLGLPSSSSYYDAD